MGRSVHWLLLAVGGLLGTLSWAGDARLSAAEGGPDATLLDTGTVSPEPLGPAAWRSKATWTVIPEDNTTHQFQGDVVLANDRLALVLRWKSAAAEVYAHTAAGWKSRGVLAAAASAGEVSGLSSVRIVENNPGAVMLNAAFKTSADKTAGLTYRLTAGQSILEIRSGEGAARVAVRSDPRYVVVPDFFGDDMVFAAGPEWGSSSRVGLPAENFFLGMLDQGNAMLMCVWQSSQREVSLVLSGESPRRSIQACEIQCVKGATMWLAVLDGAHLWHEQAAPAKAVDRPLTMDWKPPFPAKWRADVVAPRGLCASSYFRSGKEPGEPGATPCCAGLCSADCFFEGEQAVVQLQPATDGGSAPPPTAVLAYPIDRSQATPLTVFCPMDVLRNTLGVGPCQYILQTEGLASDTNPTPESVAAWVEQQFSRKKQKQAADEMGELLEQMVAHVRRAEARIAQYGGLAKELQAACADTTDRTDAGGLSPQLLDTVKRLQQVAAAGCPAPAPSQRAATAAEQLVKLVGKPDSLAECRRLGNELRAVGAVQDRTLANCRMTVRWLKEQAKAAAEPNSPIQKTARLVRTRTEEFLRGK
jgi:hypothetical protein